MKQQSSFQWQKDKCYRCKPSLYEALVVGELLVDVDGTNLFFYQLEGMNFKDSVEVLNKDEQFCAKIRCFNNDFLAVFGLYRVVSVSLKDKRIVDSVEIPTMIEKVEAGSGFATVLTSDEDGESKLVYCWKIDASGKFETRFEPVQVHLPEYEECDDQLLQLAVIISIDRSPRIYLYWRGSNQMLEVDPTRKLEERYSRVKQLSFVIDIDEETYSEIAGNKIVICSKKGGKELGTFTNDQQQFRKIISHKTDSQYYYSISNKGVKRWKLQPNAVPVLYASSQEYPVESLYIAEGGVLVGISLQKRWVLVWKNQQEMIHHSLPNEVIRKIIKMNESQVCLMLEATISKQVENEYQVEKHNKMEVYDFSQDREIAKKAVLKLEYKIDIDSSIVASDSSILFILNENTENELKKHIFRWWPFAEDKKKQIKKRQIIGGAKFDLIRLYPFDRILTFKLPQQQQMYDLFGKATQQKSQATLFDFSAKKVGEYELSGDINQIELSARNQLFALGKEKFSVYEFNTGSKNRLQKIHEFDMTVTYIHPSNNYILLKKQGSFLLYDKDFELLMKQDQNEQTKDYRILDRAQNSFVLVSNEEVSLWDLEKEQKVHLSLPQCEPNLVELINGHLVVADKWIKSYDFQTLTR